jgi:hypothetical protein
MSPTHDPSLAEALDSARSYSLIASHATDYVGKVGAMKDANPALQILVYLNGTYAQMNQGDAFPSAWYAHDQFGQKIRSNGFGNYLMDPTNSGWIENRAASAEMFLAENAADGVLIDVIGPAPVTPGYGTAVPWNGKDLWDAASWMRATAALVTAVKNSIDHPVYGNGLGRGRLYFDGAAPTSALLAVLDGGMAEDFIRSATDPIGSYRAIDDWRADVEMLVDAGRRQKPILVTTKAWSDGSQPQKDALYAYALSSFLLGAAPGARFFFSYQASQNPADQPAPLALGRLGAPGGPYSVHNGTFLRAFDNGVVAVNPGGAELSATPGAVYRGPLSAALRSPVALGPHSAQIVYS